VKIEVPADEILVGDFVQSNGRLRRIAAVLRRPGWAWPIAVDGTGWGMALGGEVITVSRPVRPMVRTRPVGCSSRGGRHGLAA
jgi:hypothetical protein